MLDEIRTRLRADMLADETLAIERLIALAALSAEDRAGISAHAAKLVSNVRNASDPGMMEVFLGEYGLSTSEGVALMCLAEAMLRVPDAETIDDLIQDKIAPHDWSAHLGHSDSTLVNASTWALMLTGRVIDEKDDPGVVGALRGVVRRLGEPVVRIAVGRAMREIGAQFVLGRTIEEAMENGNSSRKDGYTFSYDMLGEAARTDEDARRYHGAYSQAIASISTRAQSEDIRENPGISVKLSALHPRYEFGQRERMLPILSARVLQLARAAKDAKLGFNIDAEEADRLDLSLEVIEAVLSDESLAGWDGFGVVVQAYGPRTAHTIDWLYALAEKLDRRIMVRLVKGAYWDTEIKHAQVMGLDGFPVFTRKHHTDVSYIGCARKLLSMTDRIYPQFATHNAHSVAAVLHLAEGRTQDFEFQRLHGMGESLHKLIMAEAGTRCRIYAPVGAHRDLLAYLVRRLLENGANSSFVNQIVDEDVPAEVIARDPIEIALAQNDQARKAIQAPSEIFPRRRNSRGWDITDPQDIAEIEAARAPFAAPYQWGEKGLAVHNPAHPEEIVGHIEEATSESATAAIGKALTASGEWSATPVTERAAILNRIADLYERDFGELFALAAREAGKTVLDCVAELREAVDFLRYYAVEATHAEKGTHARGVIVCISPWNFPLAIFTGQIAAALVTGNAVMAKPAEQTPLMARKAIALMHEAGVPEDILALLPGPGETVGAALTADPRIAGVCFTGSTDVAKIIDRQLAKTAAPDAMLIAETGGLNAMIVDSTALPEQAVRDIVASAFQSAGQRCSALRVLYVQRDVEERLLEMLFGAMDALQIGDPLNLETDVGPVIDAEAQTAIKTYCETLEGSGRLLKQLTTPKHGNFIAPHCFRVKGIEDLDHEIFGPILHIARFDAHQIDQVVDTINARGYGLTFGLHTRIDARVQQVIDRAASGNVYINRNQIGAVVGSQPFGGEGLSGTGPKAGGPHYLPRFRKKTTQQSDVSQNDTSDTKSPSADTLATAIASLDNSDWSARHDRIGILRQALRGAAPEAMSAAAALEQGPIDLPGPTGESNRLTLAPKGTVICLGPTADMALAQAVQALATGNKVIVIAPEAGKKLTPLNNQDFPIHITDGLLDSVTLASLPVDCIALAGGDLLATRKALSQREGPIVPVISDLIAPASYSHERAVCIDTTAAGGNAALLAKVGGEDMGGA